MERSEVIFESSKDHRGHANRCLPEDGKDTQNESNVLQGRKLRTPLHYYKKRIGDDKVAWRSGSLLRPPGTLV